jgi:hypothetical protein
VVVFELRESRETPGQLAIAAHPLLLRVDAPELAKINIWSISARPLNA